VVSIRIKRAYEEPAKNDGYRVLVDRIWPRGVKKEELKIDRWLKEIAPSSELRKWFGHKTDRWPEFKDRYSKELDDKEELIRELAERARRGRLTLVFGAKNEEENNAVALKEYLSSVVSSEDSD
jgi:uncharacterized protein YeaO (DUF488 family)